MDFTYDDEQDAHRDAERGLLGKAYSDLEQRRQSTKSYPGFDEKVWTQMAEMGLLGLPFAEEDGGVGAGPVEIAIVCQEIGGCINPYLANKPIETLGRDDPFYVSLVPWQFNLQNPRSFVIDEQLALVGKDPFDARNWQVLQPRALPQDFRAVGVKTR